MTAGMEWHSRLLQGLLLLGGGFLTVYAAMAMVTSRWYLGLFDIGIAAFFFATYALFRLIRRFWWVSVLCMVTLAALFLTLFHRGGIDGSGPLWSMIVPLYLLFVLGRRHGTFGSLAYLAAALVVGTIPSGQSAGAPYSLDYLVRFVGVFLAVCLIARFFERYRAQQEAGLIQRQARLEESLQELEQSKEARRQSEQDYRQLVEQAHVGILIVQDESIRLINTHCARIIGYGREEIEGQPLDCFLPMAVHPHLHTPLGGGVADGQWPETCETALHHRDGHRIDAELSFSQIRLSGRAAILVIVRDVTRRKREAEETRLLEERVRQGQKMEAIGQLAGGVAHDFNNMLAGIMGYAELVKIGPGSRDPDAEQYGDMILQAARRASDLTAKLLAFARRGKMQAVPVDVHDTIVHTARLLEHTLDRRIEILLRLEAPKAIVRGDPSQLQNALLNLAVNARDAMPRGGRLEMTTDLVWLGVDDVQRLPYRVEDGGYVRLTVRDTGVGIPPEDLPRIFEPFFTTKAPEAGTGLGLSSVYGIVKNHGGFIEVSSQPGAGSVFVIHLPLDPAGVVLREPVPTVRRTQFSGQALVVDDEDVVRSMAARLLADLGFDVHEASNGAEALEVGDGSGTDWELVLLDINMPRMNGVDCLAELRRRRPGLAVLVMSGHAPETSADRLLEAGAVGFLAKPFDRTQLVEAVERALGWAQPGDRSPG